MDSALTLAPPVIRIAYAQLVVSDDTVVTPYRVLPVHADVPRAGQLSLLPGPHG